MRGWFTVLALAAGLALVCPAPGQAEGAKDQAWLTGDYTIDPFHTSPQFEYQHFGISRVRGRFDHTTGTLRLDAAHRRGQIDVTIAVASLSTGVALLDQRLKDSNYFDAKTFPTIRFKSADLRFKGDQLIAVVGDLTIHGVTRKATLQVANAACRQHRNPTMTLAACGANATTVINRSDFGLGAFVPLVSDAVTITIAVEAIKGAQGVEDQFKLVPKGR